MHSIIRLLLAGALAAVPALPLGAGARAAATEPDFTPTRITEGVYVIYGPLDLPNEYNRGFRNNPVIVLTGAGTVIFDPGGSAWAGERVAEVAGALSSDPIVAVFDSHAHGDHWLGNEGVKRLYPNAVIYGHPRMRERVAGADGPYWLEQIERLTQQRAGGARVVGADRTVADGDRITIGDIEFRIHHPGPAHTDNDLMIEVVERKTLFAGDVVRNGLLGLMESDSSFAGNVAAIDAILAMDIEHLIPGHGPAGGPQIAVPYRTYLARLLGKVRALYADGLADYEMKPEIRRALSEFSDWAGFDMRLGAHVSRAFLEVEQDEF